MNSVKELNNATVGKRDLPVKILQFGEGNFLRAFVDWMVCKANHAGVMNHGIVAVQPIEGGEQIAEVFKQQDCLYHVYLEGIKNKQVVKEITLVDSIVEVLNPYTQYEKYEKYFLDDGLETIISNTTEAGICYEEGDDLGATPPKSFPAKIAALLHKRYQKYKGDPTKGLQVVCCELIEDNGSTLKEYVLRHAKYNKLDHGFVFWVETACHFYDTLVDRIVTGFPRESIAEIKTELDFNDNLVVKGEYFHLWAIGGDPIIKDYLPLDKLGLNVIFMPDIKAFRRKKVRILNGAHTALVPVGLQLLCETVREAFGLPIVEKYINQMMTTEILPMIEGDTDELQDFAIKILERFHNPHLKHYLKDISLNSTSKWMARNYPTLLDNHKKLGRSAPLTTFSLAALLVLYSGKSEVEFTPNDTQESLNFIQQSFDANNVCGWVESVLSKKSIWGVDLTEIPSLVNDVSAYATNILTKGMGKSLECLLERGSQR